MSEQSKDDVVIISVTRFQLFLIYYFLHAKSIGRFIGNVFFLLIASPAIVADFVYGKLFMGGD